MTEQIVLEVINGPMDGLNCLIDKKGKIGRNVGCSLSLALDMEVSGRHAEIILEGASWCIRDLQSTNGTWLKGKKISPGKTIPVKPDDTFLIGSTIIQLFQGSILDVLSSVSNKDFNDPRKEYSLSPELSAIWDSVYASVPADGSFCDISKLFLALTSSGEKRSNCEENITGASRYKILDPWLANVTLTPYLQTMPNTLMIAPRVWRVMNLAAKKNNDPLTVLAVLKAILEEGRSIASRYIREDIAFLDHFAIPHAGHKTTGRAFFSAGNINKPVRPDREWSAPPTGSPPAPEKNGEYKILLDFAQRIEKIIIGFLDDALNPVAGAEKPRIPGLEKELSEIVSSQAADKDISGRMETLYHLLVLILAAQREGYMPFANKVCTRIAKSLAPAEESSANILSLGKKALTSQDISNTIRSTLSKIESEGLNDQTIRERIEKKFNSYKERSTLK